MAPDALEDMSGPLTLSLVVLLRQLSLCGPLQSRGGATYSPYNKMLFYPFHKFDGDETVSLHDEIKHWLSKQSVSHSAREHGLPQSTLVSSPTTVRNLSPGHGRGHQAVLDKYELVAENAGTSLRRNVRPY